MTSSGKRKAVRSDASKVWLQSDRRKPTPGWRLDVRQDNADNEPDSRRKKLFHYIASGGLRQLRRTMADDIAEQRQRAFAIFLLVLVALWIVLYFLPLE